MRVSTGVPIGSIGLLSQGSVHDRKIGPIVVVPDKAAAREVLWDHPGQHPIVIIGRDPFLGRFGKRTNS